MGLVADLTAGEILEQLVHARAVTAIRNIVFMVGCVRGSYQLVVRPDIYGIATYICASFPFRVQASALWESS